MDARIIRAKLECIREKSVVGRAPVQSWRHRAAEYDAPGAYRWDGEWVGHHDPGPEGQGASWPAGKTIFISFELILPSGDGTTGYLCFGLERLEGLLRLDGEAYCGIDENHTRVALSEAPPGRRVAAEAEFVSEPRVWCEPSLDRERGRLRSITVERVDPEVQGAWHDLELTRLAAEALPQGRRRGIVARMLERALLAVDLTSGFDRLKAGLLEAVAALREGLEGLRGDPEQGRVFLTGHSHIDTAWLWPLKETVRKCGRTFATAVHLMERFPSYRFSCSQPQLYAYTREHFPELYGRIRGLVAEGRWETTGGMWVECDCNVPSGESLIRQFLHGRRHVRSQ